jgi:hypothetical protein
MELVETLPYSRKWWASWPVDKKSALAVDLIKTALRDVILSEIPWKSTAQWRAEADGLLAAAQNTVRNTLTANADTDARSYSLNYWDQEFETKLALDELDATRQSRGYEPVHGGDEMDFMADVVSQEEFANQLRDTLSSNKFDGVNINSWNAFLTFVNEVGDNTVTRLRESELKGSDIRSLLNMTIATGKEALVDVLSSYFIQPASSGNPAAVTTAIDMLKLGNTLAANREALERRADLLPR